MEVESRKDRIIRIIKTIMFTYGFDSVQKFADEIGANYMQVYYTYIGRTTAISTELAEKILARFPDLNKKFLETGFGSVKAGEEEEPEEDVERPHDEITAADMFRLLERVTTLLEKVQERENLLLQKMEELKRREEKLEERLKDADQNFNVCG